MENKLDNFTIIEMVNYITDVLDELSSKEISFILKESYSSDEINQFKKLKQQLNNIFKDE